MPERHSASVLVEQFRRGGVPRDLRLMAAQGLLPLKPGDLLEMWTVLIADPDEGVRRAADNSLSSFPAAELQPILKSRDTPPGVLSWAVTHRPEQELREIVLQNTSLPDETIEALAPTLPQALAELVVVNLTRLLRRTSLLVALESNGGLSNDQKQRLRELRETFRVGQAEAVRPPAPEAPPAPLAAPEPEIAPIGDVFLTENEYTVKILSEEERQQTEKVSAVQKIYRLNTAEKLITALKGFREERAILIRDPNRLVWSAVLDSPYLTEGEIEAFAATKNVSEQVLRFIGNHPEWTKRYQVVKNLVCNPRTPIGIALTLVPRLNPRDIRAIAADRNVQEAARRAAQRFQEVPRPYAADPTLAREICTRVWGEFVATAKSCDADKIASCFTKEAILVLPDTPALIGRDQVRQHLLRAYEGVKVLDMAFTLDLFEVVGKQAFTFASLDRLIQQGSAPPTRSQARCGVVWQRQVDSTWQILHFLVNYRARP